MKLIQLQTRKKSLVFNHEGKSNVQLGLGTSPVWNTKFSVGTKSTEKRLRNDKFII